MGSVTKNQPSDLQSPVPGAEAQNAVPPPSPIPAPVSAPDPSSLPSSPSPSSSPPNVAEAGAAGPTPEAGPAPSTDPMDTASLFDQLQQIDAAQSSVAGPNDERPIGFIDEAKLRAITGVGQGAEQIERLAQKMLPKDFTTRIKGDSVQFKKNGSKIWHPLDLPAFRGGIHEIFMDVADVFGIGLGNAVGAAKGAVEGGAQGAVAGAALAAVPGIGPALEAGGTALGAWAGASTGAAVGETAVRQAVLAAFDKMGSPEEVSKDLMWATGINAAGLKLGELLGFGGKKAISLAEDIVKGSPMRRVQQLAGIRQSLEEVASSIGVKNASPKETGVLVKNAVDHVEDELASRVGVVKGLMETKFAGQTVPVDIYASKIEEILNSVGIDKITIQKMDLSKGLKKNVMDGLRAQKAFGDPDAAEGFVNRLLSDYRRINQANIGAGGQLPGGFEVPEMFDTLKYWQGQAAYKPGISSDATDAMEGMARQLRGALAQDRNAAAQGAFKGTPQEDIVQSAMKDYSSKIDAITGIKKLFDQKKSVELFTDALFEKGNSDRIVDLKAILGDSSPEFQAMKAHWMGKVYDKAVDPNTGVVNGKALRDSLKGYGEDVLNEILPSRERVALNYIAQKAEKIGYSDILNNSEAKQTVKDGVQTAVLNTSNPGPMVRMFWNLTRGNAEAAKYLADDGLLQVVQNIHDPIKGEKALIALDYFRKLIAATDVVAKPDGRKILKPRDFEDFITNPKAMEKMGMTQEQFIKMANDVAGVQSKPAFGPQAASAPGAISLRVAPAVHDSIRQRQINTDEQRRRISQQAPAGQ